MRTLSAPLLAAQKSASAVPYLKVELHDRIGGVRRLAWERLYTGAEPDGFHAACVPGDGSLIRARVAGGHVYYQRVASPGVGSDFSSWTDLGTAADAGVALCADGSRVLLFYVDAGGTLVKVRESTDNGATLGAAATAAAAAGAVTWVAADVKPGGDAAVFYSVAATVYAAKRTSGVWGAPAAWTNSAASVSGLACYHLGDWNLAVAGTDAAGQALLWSCLLGDGFSLPAGTWSSLREVMRASAGSSVVYRAPFLTRDDTFHLTLIETFTGTAAYSRPFHAHSPATADFALNLWTEPVPFDLASEYGQAIAFGSSAAWLSTPSGVWMADAVVPTLAVTADVLECTATDEPFGGRLRLVLRNEDGRYTELTPPLKVDGEVRIAPGYQTASGPAASEGPYYWIDGVERRTGKGQGSVVITARNGWGLLEAWRARRTHAWAAGEKNVFGILQHLFARTGLEFDSGGASIEAAGTYPAFTVHPGESALTAVRRLLATVPDEVFLRAEFAFLKEPLVSEASSYAYGTDHDILAGRYADEAPAANRVQAFGSGVFGERFEWASVASGRDRLAQVHDLNATTQAEAEDRADAVLRKATREAASGEITVPVNCGQELYDVVEVTDAPAGLSAAKRRVVGMELRHSAEAGVYEQRLALGAA